MIEPIYIMDRPRIIGITGKAGHGKDTAARFVQEIIGGKIRSFADPLKEVCMILFHLTKEDLYTQDGKARFNLKLNMTHRELLQKMGTEVFRKQLAEVFPQLPFKGIWVWNMEQHIKEAKEPIIIPDLRFEDEARMLKERGATIIRIVRNMEELVGESALHASELEQAAIVADITIVNDGTLEALKLKLQKIILN